MFSSELLNECIDKMASGFLITSKEGIILYFNSEYIRLTKLYSAKPGEHILKYQKTGEIVGMPACVEAAQKKKKVIRNFTQTKDGIFIVSSSDPIFAPNGEIAYVVTRVHDMTDFFAIEDDISHVRKIFESLANTETEPEDYGADVVANSFSFRHVLDTAKTVAKFDIPILLMGESGVGKDVVARFIHKNSSRAKNPFIAINCAAIPNELLETELFGYAKGTFTGQISKGKEGLFEAANGGTLFLDEIGDMPLSLQSKILRVLENKSYRPVGSNSSIETDVRIISATNHDLHEMINTGQFREDLFYRINVMEVLIPPLRERRDDIIPLSLHFLRYFNEKYKFSKTISTKELQKMLDYDWPGNIRQLRNSIEMMIVINDGDIITVPEFIISERIDEIEKIKKQAIIETIDDDEKGPAHSNAYKDNQMLSLKDYLARQEKEYLIEAYTICKTTRKLAEALHIDHSTVIRKLKKHEIHVLNLK